MLRRWLLLLVVGLCGLPLASAATSDVLPGRLIYPDYTRWPDGSDLRVINPDGSNDTHVLSVDGIIQSPVDLSADGTRVVFSFTAVPYSGPSRIFAFDLLNRQLTQLTDGSLFAQWPSFSPDASHIAYIETTDAGENVLAVMDADGTNKRRLSSHDAERPQWSPDGSRIGYYDRGALRFAPADGTPAPAGNGSIGRFMRWAPDGRTIVATDYRQLLTATVADDGSLTDVQVIHEVPTGTLIMTPGWSPDGSSLYFMREKSGVRGDLMRIGPDGSGATSILQTEVYGADWGPVALPDSPTHIVSSPGTIKRLPTGTPASVRATLFHGGVPQAGIASTWSIEGANASSSGSCEPVDCRSDGLGNVTFTYTAGAAGRDLVHSCAEDACTTSRLLWRSRAWVVGVTPSATSAPIGGDASATIRVTVDGAPAPAESLAVRVDGANAQQIACQPECGTNDLGELAITWHGTSGGMDTIVACRRASPTDCGSATIAWDGPARWDVPTPEEGAVLNAFQGRTVTFALRASDPNPERLGFLAMSAEGLSCGSQTPSNPVEKECSWSPRYSGRSTRNAYANFNYDESIERRLILDVADVVVSAAPAQSTAMVGDIQEVVVSTSAAGGPLAGQSLDISSDAGGSIVSADVQTNAAGRAVVRLSSTKAGVQNISVRGVRNCPEHNDCASVRVNWTPRQHTCDGRGFVAYVPGQTTQASIGLKQQLCPAAGQPDVVSYRSVNSNLEPSGSVERRYSATGSSVIANVADATIGPLRVTFADATSQSRCDAAGVPSQTMTAGLVTIRNGTSVVFEGRPGPGTVIDVPGVGRVVLNVQTGAVDPGARTATGRVTAVSIKLANGTTGRFGEAESTVKCVIPIGV